MGHLTHNIDVVPLNIKTHSLHVLTKYLYHTLYNNDVTKLRPVTKVPLFCNTYGQVLCVICCNEEKQKGGDKMNEAVAAETGVYGLHVLQSELEVSNILGRLSPMGHSVSFV